MEHERERRPEDDVSELDREAWNLPRPQTHLIAVSPSEWPADEQAYDYEPLSELDAEIEPAA
jgi:hypothetical protein